MSVEVLSAIITAIAAIGVALVSLMGARRAQDMSHQNRVQQQLADQLAKEDRVERKEAQARAAIEAQAYIRARESYERIVKDLEGQLDRNQHTVQRVQDQLDQVIARLSTEQEVSNELRHRVWILQGQIAELQRENEAFRQSIEADRGAIGDLYKQLPKPPTPSS